MCGLWFPSHTLTNTLEIVLILLTLVLSHIFVSINHPEDEVMTVTKGK